MRHLALDPKELKLFQPRDPPQRPSAACRASGESRHRCFSDWILTALGPPGGQGAAQVTAKACGWHQCCRPCWGFSGQDGENRPFYPAGPHPTPQSSGHQFGKCPGLRTRWGKARTLSYFLCPGPREEVEGTDQGAGLPGWELEGGELRSCGWMQTPGRAPWCGLSSHLKRTGQSSRSGLFSVTTTCGELDRKGQGHKETPSGNWRLLSPVWSGEVRWRLGSGDPKQGRLVPTRPLAIAGGQSWLGKKVVCSPPRSLGRAFMGMSVWKTSLDCITSLMLAVVEARSQQPSPAVWKGTVLSAWWRVSPAADLWPWRRGSRDAALRWEWMLQKMCPLFVSRRSKNPSIIYRTVPFPSRRWLHVERAEKKKRTRHQVQNNVTVSWAPSPFFTLFPICNSYWVPERRGTTLKNN